MPGSVTAQEIVSELKSLGSGATKKVLSNHGIKEPFFGVKVSDLAKIQKRVKTDHPLALELYDTGIHDAMYFASLIVDTAKMTRKDLQRWAEQASNPMLSEHAVARVAAGGKHARELALEWIDSSKESIAAAGWTTLANLVSKQEAATLGPAELRKLLARIQKTIHDQPNRVRYAMNGFVIAVGSSVDALQADALQAAGKIGKVTVNMGNTACKVPDAAAYILKATGRGDVAKKSRTAKRRE